MDPVVSCWFFFTLGFLVWGVLSSSQVFTIYTFEKIKELVLVRHTILLFYWLNNSLTSNAYFSHAQSFSLFWVGVFLVLSWWVTVFPCQNYLLPNANWFQLSCFPPGLKILHSLCILRGILISSSFVNLPVALRWHLDGSTTFILPQILSWWRNLQSKFQVSMKAYLGWGVCNYILYVFIVLML